MDPLAKSNITTLIKLKAVEIGFDKVGVARAEELTDEGGRLRKWLEMDFHGNMKWMEREPEKRSDPRILFPGAKSLVVLALNYFTPHRHQDSSTTGKISRYAWGDDYHDIIKNKLRQLLGWIQDELPGTNGKVCVDTAPIMDKAWAVRAGLGWIGKHTNLITRELGSWVFIGEVLLDIELDYENELVDDHCGSCTACLDACPTAAIVKPYVVDSNKCISYATIELRDPDLPFEITENLEGWLYGCDICQDVCPWNRFEKPASVTQFHPRPGNVSRDLNEILKFSHEEYSAAFRRSAIKRTKIDGLKRNARALLDGRLNARDGETEKQ